MGRIEDIKQELAELRATYHYYVRSSESSMAKVKDLVEEAARSKVSAEELRRQIVQLEAELSKLEKQAI